MCPAGSQGRVGPGNHDHVCEDSEALRFGVTSVHVPHALLVHPERPDWFLTPSPFHEYQGGPIMDVVEMLHLKLALDGVRHLSLNLRLSVVHRSMAFLFRHTGRDTGSSEDTLGLPRWLSDKEPTSHYRRCQRCGFDPWVRKIL